VAVASWKQSRRRRRTAKGRRRGKGTMAALQGRSLADRSGRRPGERRPAGKQFQILIYLGEANYYFKHNKTPVIHTSTLRTTACSFGCWLMARADLLREKSTAGWLLVAEVELALQLCRGTEGSSVAPSPWSSGQRSLCLPCVILVQKKETTDHLFFSCPFARKCWTSIHFAWDISLSMDETSSFTH
jgi:hypothetical protein